MDLQCSFIFNEEPMLVSFDPDTHEDKCEDWESVVEYYVEVDGYTFCINIPRTDIGTWNPIDISKGGFIDWYEDASGKYSDISENTINVDIEEL